MIRRKELDRLSKARAQDPEEGVVRIQERCIAMALDLVAHPAVASARLQREQHELLEALEALQGRCERWLASTPETQAQLLARETERWTLEAFAFAVTQDYFALLRRHERGAPC